MKILRVLLAALVIGCAGCLELDQTLTLSRNGSGTFEVEYSLAERSIVQLNAMFDLEREMAKSAGQEQIAAADIDTARLLLDPTERRLAEKLAEYERYGVTVESLTVDTRSARRVVELTLHFKDLAELAKTDFFREHGFSLSRGTGGEYTLSRAAENSGQTQAPALPGPEAVKLLTPILQGFRVAMKVRTPGAIVRSNADRKAMYSASWVYDFATNPNALQDLQTSSLMVVFDGKDIDLPEVKQERSNP